MGKSYKDLIAWQRSMELARIIYHLTNAFPNREVYGLSAQMRRCAVSLPSNIAEGQGRLSHLKFRKFLSNALGSLAELETQIILSTDFGFISREEAAQAEKLAGEIGQNDQWTD